MRKDQPAAPRLFIFVLSVLCSIALLAENSHALVPGTGPAVKKIGKALVKKGTRPGVKSLGKMSPRLTRQAIRLFGAKNARFLSRGPAPDTVRLVRYAQKATTPAAKEILLRYYKKGGARVLDNLSWDRILASGMSVAMITAAYQVSNGVQEGVGSIAENSPEIFSRTVVGIAKWMLILFSLPMLIYFSGRAIIRVILYKPSQNK